MMHQSIATISSPEFINLQPLDINPLMSKCEIKVLYIGENRNHSYITEEVAADMAKTLRGAPIVGYYKEDKEDFADHGEQIILDDEGVKFNCLTKPYGFVSPDAKVWFQDFEDTDDFGNKITRKYLMTTGYLWTGQYEEVQRVIEKGNNQSMELDEATLDGHWSTDVNNGMDFFIINDAIFSKLCILGEDVEPCFEGASVTAPQVSKSFSKLDNNFKQTLFTMMQDLKFALEGGKEMELEENNIETTAVSEEAVEKTEEEVATEVEENAEVEIEIEEEATEETDPVEEDSNEDDAETSYENAEENNEAEEGTTEEELDNSDDVEEKKKEYSLEDYENLKTAYDELENKYNSLVEFKKAVELKEKQALIKSFYMLSDEDKKEVIEHIEEYSLEDIESKLCVICVKNKVNFEKENLDENNNKVEEENSAVTTFNINENDSTIPAWISACIDTQNSKK